VHCDMNIVILNSEFGETRTNKKWHVDDVLWCHPFESSAMVSLHLQCLLLPLCLQSRYLLTFYID
jgi:hypothetical protein